MKARAKQPDKALMRRRVEEIVRIRLDGAEWWDCCEYVREKEREEGSAWHLAEGQKPLSDASLRRYLSKADRAIAESCRASRKILLRRHLAQRRSLFAKAVSQGDVRTALACLDSEAKLRGLFELDFARQLEEMQKQLEEIKANGTGNAQATGPAHAGGTAAPDEPGDGGPGPAAG
jgi:hypothetical protein